MARPEVMQAIPVKPRKRLSQPKVASQLCWRNDGAVTEAEVCVAPAAPQCARRLEWNVTVLLRSGKSSHCFANVGHMREAHQQNAHFAQQRSPLSSFPAPLMQLIKSHTSGLQLHRRGFIVGVCAVNKALPGREASAAHPPPLIMPTTWWGGASASVEYLGGDRQSPRGRFRAGTASPLLNESAAAFSLLPMHTVQWYRFQVIMGSELSDTATLCQIRTEPGARLGGKFRWISIVQRNS